LTWREAKPLLDAYDVPVPETRLATDADAAVDHADVIGYPVVLKVDSAAVPHRTDADAVRVGLEGPDAARDAYREIRANVEDYDPEADVEGVLVQRHHAEGVETLVGVSQEAGFGPVVTVGPGGTLVELLDDAAVRIAPLSTDDARAAIEATALSDLLAGHRGAAGGDADALAALVRRVGTLATEVDAVRELDLNPVVVDDDATALDVLVRTQ
jgi:acetyltransferase